jgi:hypothetical protein
MDPITIVGNANNKDPLPSSYEVRRSVLSGLTPEDQRAGRTDAQIMSRLEQATGTKGVPGLSLAAGMGSRAKVDVIDLEARLIESDVVKPVHTGTAQGKATLDALEAGLARRGPLAVQTATMIAKEIWKYRPGAGGSFEYERKNKELGQIGDALRLMPKEQQRLADIVRELYPKDRRVTMDDSGRLGSAQELAAREAYDRFEVVSKADTTMGSIAAGMTGLAGGSVNDMKAAAHIGNFIEAGGSLITRPLTDATEATTQTERVKTAKVIDKVSPATGPPAPPNTNQVLRRPQRITGETLSQIVKSAPRQGWGKERSKEYGAEIVLNDKNRGSGLKPDVEHRMASHLSDEQLNSGIEFDIIGGDNKIRKLVQVPDVWFKGKNDQEWKKGITEYVIENGAVTHQRFIEGGKVTGRPNQKASPNEPKTSPEASKSTARSTSPPTTPPPEYVEPKASKDNTDTKSTAPHTDPKSIRSTP